MKINIKTTFYLLAILTVAVIGYVYHEKVYSKKTIVIGDEELGEIKDTKKEKSL